MTVYVTPIPKPEPRKKKARKRLRPFSEKRAATFEPRRECMVIVRDRDRFCQFPIRMALFAREVFDACIADRQIAKDFEIIEGERCWHPPDEPYGDGHEPELQSAGADYTDPDQVVLICRLHHGWITRHPKARKIIGL